MEDEEKQHSLSYLYLEIARTSLCLWQNVCFENNLMCDKWGMEPSVGELSAAAKRRVFQITHPERAKHFCIRVNNEKGAEVCLLSGTLTVALM